MKPGRQPGPRIGQCRGHAGQSHGRQENGFAKPTESDPVTSLPSETKAQTEETVHATKSVSSAWPAREVGQERHQEAGGRQAVRRKDVSVPGMHVLGLLLRVLLLVVVTTIIWQEFFLPTREHFSCRPGSKSYQRPFGFRARARARSHACHGRSRKSYGCKCARLYQLASWILDMRSNDS